MAQLNELSNREREVLKLLLEGKSNKLIASSLNISESTVEFHLKNIYAKSQVSSRTELILKLGKSTVADDLGDSTVESKPEVADNGHRLNLSNLSASFRKAVSTIGKEFDVNTVMNSDVSNAGNPMTFFESIRLCLTKYADFNGRASRAEFWWFFLFVSLVVSALTYVSNNIASVFLIAFLLPLLAAGSRRLHDSARSAYWELFLMAPVGGIILLCILWALPPVSAQPDDTLPA